MRALGQALERFGLVSFELELQGENILVRGELSVPETKVSFSRLFRELLTGRPPANCPSGQIDLRFLPHEIETFDSCGKDGRQDACKLPNPYSISQILRGVGAYLDNRPGSVPTSIALKGKWVGIHYQTAEGRLERVAQHLEYFYDYWTNMYLRRSNRPKLVSDKGALQTANGPRQLQFSTS
ncbi:MAG TPA: hypothetical protein VJQ55_04000 [Candidatus Binatia bacterium]|nr:hypothetical protein [Candidatus Binatia bacterium]